MKIDWNNLELEKKTNAELLKIRHFSYSRYDPPNLHGIWMMLGIMIIMYAFMSSHTVIMCLIGGICLLIYAKKAPRSRQRWQEMEQIRNKIDEEFQKRDTLLGL